MIMTTKPSDRIILDISPCIDRHLPVWPGDTAFESSTTWQIGANCPVKVSKMSMTTHLGAHCDAPSHYEVGGISIDQVGLDAYIGPCRVIHCIGQAQIRIEHIAHAIENLPARVLIRTYQVSPNHWDEQFAAIAAETIAFLATHKVKLIGVDTPSLDPQQSKTLDAHLAVHAANMAILEGIVLDQVAEGDYELIALPLKFAEMDASPVRAILRTL